MQEIDAVGGSRFVEILKSAKIVPASTESKVDAQLAENLGRCTTFFYKNDYAAAISECSRAAKISPDSPWPEMGLAEMAIAQKKYDDAVTFAQKAVAVAPSMAEAHFSLGEAFALNGNADGAVDELNETLQLDPNHIDALILLGDLHRPSDNSDSKAGEIALSYYRRAVALESDFPD
ncbi:MAG: tetratricopeptide repeat protein, partial [Candidatus Acidiferrales bacterium]